MQMGDFQYDFVTVNHLKFNVMKVKRLLILPEMINTWQQGNIYLIKNKIFALEITE